MRWLAALVIALAVGTSCAEYKAPEGVYQCAAGTDCLDGWGCVEAVDAGISICVEGAGGDADTAAAVEVVDTTADGPEP